MNAEQFLGMLASRSGHAQSQDDDTDLGPNKSMDVQVGDLLVRQRQMETAEVPPIGTFVKANAMYRMPNDKRPGLVVEHIAPDQVKYEPVSSSKGCPVERPDVIVAVHESESGVMLLPIDSRFLEIHHEAMRAAENL